MAVNKNFVVKNGLEVNTDLIVADVDSSKVGIGTTISSYLLHVYQGTGIGASSVYVTGISTVAQEFNVGLGGSVFTVLGNAEGTAGIGQSVGVGTGEPAYLLDVRAPVSTGQTALYVQGDMRITGDINLDDLRLDQLRVGGISTFIGLSTFAAGINVLGLGATTTTLDVSGFSTFSDTVKVDTLTENRVVIVGSGKTLEDDANFTYDGGQLRVGTGLSVTGLSTFVGVGTFISDLYVGGDLFISENISLDTNLNILGIATVGTLDVTSDATIDGTLDGADGHKSLVVGTGLSVHGPSAGVAVTLAGAGGITTTGGDFYVGGDLYINEDVILDTNLSILGIATVGTLEVTGISSLGLGVTVAGYGVTTTQLNVSGVSSVSGVSTAALFGGYAALSAPASAETKNFAVTVAAKTSNNRYSGGSSNAYYIDGIEAPFLTLTPGRTYRFTLSSSDMSSHPFRFYLEADKTTAYTTDVTSTSTYTEIIVTDTTPTVLHYQCSSHAYMGNSVQTNSNTIVVSAASTFSGAVDINAALDVDGHTELDDVNVSGASTFAGAADFNGDIDVDGHTELDNVAISGIVTVTGNIDANSNADINGDLNVNGHTDLDFVIVSAASTFQSDIFVGTGATVGFGSTAYFRDNAKAVFGDGEDLKIYHNGTDSYVSDTDSGSLILTGSRVIVKNAADNERMIDALEGGAVKLLHNNSEKLETTGYGVTVSGGAFVSGISTFVGFVTFSDYAFVQDGLNVAGVVTATSFDGLGQIGVGSEGTFIGVGITMVDFKSSNAGNTVDVDGTSGIATVTVTTGVSIGLAIALGG